MPLDPFFTSKAKDEFHEKHQRSRAYAKAFQFQAWTSRLSKTKFQKAMDHQLMGPQDKSLRALAATGGGGIKPVPGGRGHPSLQGFKEPKKMWKHRKY